MQIDFWTDPAERKKAHNCQRESKDNYYKNKSVQL